MKQFDSENLSLGDSDKTESDLNSQERHNAKNANRTFKTRPLGKRQRDLENSDRDWDVHSSRDFWQDIEPRMNKNTQ